MTFAEPPKDSVSRDPSAPLWIDEVGFSNWLHLNIGLLATAISIPLVSRQREARVGRLSADLLAEVKPTGELVIIENQIYTANHGHFGQVLTYAAHYDAEAIIWIATSFRNEYRAAIAWLNSLSQKQFFAVELLDAATGAPRLEVVAGPDTVVRSSPVQQTVNSAPSADARIPAQHAVYVTAPFAVPTERTTSPGQLVLNAIFELIATMLSGSPLFPRLRKPTGDRNYYVISAGPVRSSEWAITFEDAQVGVGLVLNDPASSKRDLALVREHASELNVLLGYDVDYRTVDNRIKQKVLVYRPFSYEQRSQEGEAIARWCVETVTAFAANVQRLGLFYSATVRETH